MDNKPEKIKLGENEEEFYVIEQTRLGGCNYILVADSEDGDGDAMILKDMSAAEDEFGLYVDIEDEDEFNAVADIFSDMLSDSGIDIEK